jgi:GntR family transcriptional repressor for pyruvate dehydrogenase complex
MRVSFGTVVEARSAIEPEIARMAALHRTGAQLEELRAVLEAMLATTNQAAFRPTYSRFHGLLGEMANNLVLEVVQATLRQVSEPLHEQVDWGPRSGRAAVQTHVRLFDAVAAGDAATAENELADHMHWYRQYFERRYPELLAQTVRWVPSA